MRPQIKPSISPVPSAHELQERLYGKLGGASKFIQRLFLSASRFVHRDDRVLLGDALRNQSTFSRSGELARHAQGEQARR